MGSFYQFTSRVERTKGLEDKTEFWDRLMTMTMINIFREHLQKAILETFDQTKTENWRTAAKSNPRDL